MADAIEMYLFISVVCFIVNKQKTNQIEVRRVSVNI